MPAWAQLLIRTVFLFFFTLVLVRLLGKRHPSKTSPSLFVVYVTLGVMTAIIAFNLAPNVSSGLIGLGVWAALLALVDYLVLRSKSVHDLVYGKETVLVKQGKIMEENLKKPG
jgi:uncharacterized membrane protein YcaP (DUF421 family)